jgi:hypothetical protein
LRSRRDQHHAAADRAFRAAIEPRLALVTTNLIIAETYRLTLFRAASVVIANVKNIKQISVRIVGSS